MASDVESAIITEPSAVVPANKGSSGSRNPLDLSTISLHACLTLSIMENCFSAASAYLSVIPAAPSIAAWYFVTSSVVNPNSSNKVLPLLAAAPMAVPSSIVAFLPVIPLASSPAMAIIASAVDSPIACISGASRCTTVANAEILTVVFLDSQVNLSNSPAVVGSSCPNALKTGIRVSAIVAAVLPVASPKASKARNAIPILSLLLIPALANSSNVAVTSDKGDDTPVTLSARSLISLVVEPTVIAVCDSAAFIFNDELTIAIPATPIAVNAPPIILNDVLVLAAKESIAASL